MIVSNRGRGTWRRDVDAFIALTEHSRSKFIAGGLPADRIFVKPNFVEDSGQPACPPSASDVVLYAGRLSKEKGVAALLSAWAGAALGRHGRLVIAGDGPERATLEGQASLLGLSPPEVTFAGYQPAPKLHALIEGSRAMVVPSIWYETFGRVVIEAFCHARPVVVSDIGAIGELVHHGGTGLKFPPGDAAALGEALRTILGDGSLAGRLGANARAEYLAKYTPERNFEMLMRIYRFAIERKGNAVPEMLRSFEPATPTVHQEPADVAHA
jgi:glycosyltransferase involved in cell wall biosynthesis